MRDAGKDIPQIIGQHEKLLIDGLDFPVDVLYVQDGGFLNILILHSTQRLAQIQVDDGENRPRNRTEKKRSSTRSLFFLYILTTSKIGKV